MTKHRIMVVDDDTYTIDLYNMIISWTPYGEYLRTEKNAERALETLEGLHDNSSDGFPDFILLDLRMPEMHGFEFIRRFRERFPEKEKCTRFIITTSSVIKEERDEAENLGCVRDFLIKPIPRDYLEQLITRGLDPPG